MASLRERLIEILINNKLITQEQFKEALDIQKNRGGKLSDIIVEHNFINEKDLASALSEGLGFPLIDLKRFKIDSEIVSLIPADVARRYQILPLSKIGDTITLAMADPLNIFAIDYVKTFTGFKINPIITSLQDIIQAIESSYPDATAGIIDGLVQEMKETSIELIKENKEVILSNQELQMESRSSPVIKITDLIMRDGVRSKASDILIEPQENFMRIRYRIDGLLREQKAPPKKMHASIISRIKVLSGLDIAERRVPQDGRFKAKIDAKEVDFRVNSLPTAFGEKIAIRILDKAQTILNLEKLGFRDITIKKIERVALLPHGMILVCGPTGSGKSTTLYSILKFVDSPEKNIVTVEDPVEFQLDGINQVPARPEIGLTFASSLRSILRQDPDIIMIGEIRDFETVDIAIKSALTGHLVLSTLHTTTAPGAVIRMVNMGVEPYLINSSLACVIAQRLLRKICFNCKEEYEASREILERVKIESAANKAEKFYKGKGCTKCFNTGYSGRMVVAEPLIMSPGIRELILKREQEQVIKALARKEGMETLRECAMVAARQGVTSLEEVLRVTGADE